MDDPESEWEIKESSTGNSENGKLSWMVRLGRKILVSGIVLSSAPLVLPPIMAISAIGFVCSVPYGVFLVSYACTKTLMSRLLPMPSSAAPLLLEYGKAFNGDEKEEEANGDQNHQVQNEVIKGGISIEREEEELKEDSIEEIEVRIELVDKGNEELDKGDILQKGAYQEDGVENDEKKSAEEVDEIVAEDDLEFMNERPSKSFEQVKETTGLKVEQPILEESRNEQPADKGHCIEAVVEGDEKRSSNIEKKTPLGSENVKEKEELVREMRQSVENVDARRKRKKKTKSKSEGTTKGKGEHSIKGSANEQPGDKKGRDNVNKQKTVEPKNVALDVENDELVRNPRGSLERNRKEGRSCDAAEDKQGVEKEKVDAKVEISKGDEGTTRRKQEQPLIEESLAEQPVDDKVIGALGGLEGSEKRDKETPLDGKNLPVQLIQAIDVEENEKSIRTTGEKSKEMKVQGTKEVKEEEYVRDGSMSEQPIEEVCNIAVELEGDEKNGSNMENETPFQMKKVDVHLSQSTDIEEDKELVRETRGLLEKIGDEGKTSFVDDKLSTEKVYVGTEKDDKQIFGNIENAKNRYILTHDGVGKPTSESETKVVENKAENKTQMKEFVEILDALSKETKMGKDTEGLSEEMDVEKRAQSIGPVSETVHDDSITKGLTVESATMRGGGQADVNEDIVEPNYRLNMENKDVVLSNEDVREINEEQGLDLLENLSTVSLQGSPPGVNTEESRPSSSYSVHQEVSDSSDLPVSTKAQGADDIRISAENAIDAVSDEAIHCEEKIWEQMNALRTIVGYKAARKETCIEELKTLYLFTGIEPPASLKVTCDLAEVDAKLGFLKSVVGVK